MMISLEKMEVEGQPEQPAQNSIEADLKPVSKQTDTYQAPPSTTPSQASFDTASTTSIPDFDDEIPFLRFLVLCKKRSGKGKKPLQVQ